MLIFVKKSNRIINFLSTTIMLKHFYEKDLEKIKINSQLKEKISKKLFEKNNLKLNTYLNKWVSAVTVVTLVILLMPGIYLFSRNNTDFSIEHFFEQAYAAYENQPFLNNLIYYYKYQTRPGRDAMAYQEAINEKKLAYTAIHQPDKLAQAKQLMQEGHFNADLESANFYPGTVKTYEQWFDSEGNYLNLDFKNGKRHYTYLQQLDPLTQKFNLYDNYEFPSNMYFSAPVVTECVEIPPKNATSWQKKYLLRIAFLNNGQTEVRPNFLPTYIDTKKLFQGTGLNALPEKIENLSQITNLLTASDPMKNPQKTIKLLGIIQDSKLPNVNFEYLSEKDEQGKKYKIFRLRYPFDISVSYLTDYGLEYDFNLPAIQQSYYFFDASNYQLNKMTHSVVFDGKEFELAEDELFQEYQEKNAQAKIFDPALYPNVVKFETEPGCYINKNSQKMEKMTPEEQQNFWASVPFQKNTLIKRQKQEVLDSIRE